MNHFQFLLNLKSRYSDIPFEVIIKQDILRLGIRFSRSCFSETTAYKSKDYFIFSFDLESLDDIKKKDAHLLKAPEEIQLFGGTHNFRTTTINVRLNSTSPYTVDLRDGTLTLYCESESVSNVRFHPYPKYYNTPLSSGKKISQIAPVIEWGYLIYLTVFRLCQYWGKNEECQFCDINNNYRQQRENGREYTSVKDIKDVVEALEIIDCKDNTAKAITITGGSILHGLNKKDECSFYSEYAEAIHQKFEDRWILKAVVEAYTKEDCKRLFNSGIRIYHPNYEVWDQHLFSRLCPGKERFVGRDEWMKRIVDAADIFGPEHVIPNFVAGIELSSPHGYTDYKKALKSTREGLDFFMSKGIIPRFTTWCREPLSHLGLQAAPPLEYYIELLIIWRDLFEKYQLPVPPGYGEPGLGNAVFSVSAFMDVIRV